MHVIETTVFVNKVSETRVLPPSIPLKWRGWRGLGRAAPVERARPRVGRLRRAVGAHGPSSVIRFIHGEANSATDAVSVQKVSDTLSESLY